MKHCYKLAGALLLAVGLNRVQGQTHYGMGAGTVGINHSFFGVDAGKINKAEENTFLGQSAGAMNMLGSRNTFVGSMAGEQTQGSNANSNTFIGSSAGRNNKSGLGNTFIGGASGLNFDGGDGNVALGYNAMYFGLGNYTVAVGYSAGQFNKADRNVFVGDRSGRENRTGVGNAFFGAGSGINNETGNHNTFVGSGSGANTISDDNTYSGFEAGHLNNSGNKNSFFGSKAGYNNETGNNNSFFGHNAGASNIGGAYNTYLGFNSGGTTDLQFATAIGANALVTKDHSIVLGTIFDYVGIGVSAPSYLLQLGSNSAAKPGTSTWTIASDQRLKKDISDYKEGLDLLKQIKPVWFSYNGQADMPTDKKFVGIIAQDMQKIAPHMVGTFTYQDSLGNKTEYLDYDANALTYMLVNSVKEQQQIIEEKNTKIEEMSTQVEDLTKRLAQLERIVAANMTKPLTNPASRTGAEANKNGVVLEQNAPNGFSGKSSIGFFIPENIREAVMNIYSTDGKKLRSEKILQRGNGAFEVSAGDFGSGVFVYDLVTDGQSNGARKMVVNK